MRAKITVTNKATSGIDIMVAISLWVDDAGRDAHWQTIPNEGQETWDRFNQTFKYIMALSRNNVVESYVISWNSQVLIKGDQVFVDGVIVKPC